MRFEKLPELSRRIAQPKSTIYWRIGKGEFVPPIKQGERAAAWIVEEVDEIMRAQAAGASGDEIRALVRKLVADRKGGTERKAAA